MLMKKRVQRHFNNEEEKKQSLDEIRGIMKARRINAENRRRALANELEGKPRKWQKARLQLDKLMAALSRRKLELPHYGGFNEFSVEELQNLCAKAIKTIKASFETKKVIRPKTSVIALHRPFVRSSDSRSARQSRRVGRRVLSSSASGGGSGDDGGGSDSSDPDQGDPPGAYRPVTSPNPNCQGILYSPPSPWLCPGS
jgi:hypothetical protein